MKDDKKSNLQTTINIALGVLILALFAQMYALKTEVRVVYSQHLDENHHSDDL
tara:strand:- start:258 stop:416 length:159 start_codon:yes stop_codon:yes gene_type:complete